MIQQENAQTTCKIMEKRKKMCVIFQHFQLMIWKQRKHKSVLMVYIYSAIAKTQEYLHNKLKGLQLY